MVLTMTVSRIKPKQLGLCKNYFSLQSYCRFCAKQLRKAKKQYFRETLKQLFKEKQSLI